MIEDSEDRLLVADGQVQSTDSIRVSVKKPSGSELGTGVGESFG